VEDSGIASKALSESKSNIFDIIDFTKIMRFTIKELFGLFCGMAGLIGNIEREHYD